MTTDRPAASLTLHESIDCSTRCLLVVLADAQRLLECNGIDVALWNAKDLCQACLQASTAPVAQAPSTLRAGSQKVSGSAHLPHARSAPGRRRCGTGKPSWCWPICLKRRHHKQWAPWPDLWKNAPGLVDFSAWMNIGTNALCQSLQTTITSPPYLQMYFQNSESEANLARCSA